MADIEINIIPEVNIINIEINENGGGGGAVDSVNGQTGIVVLDTGDIDAVTDKRYVTDAQLTLLGNTSGTNTGDNAANTTSNSYADGKVTDAIVNGVTTVAPSQNAVYDALALKADTSAIPTALSQLSEDVTHRVVTDAQLVVLGNTSGANSGDETTSTIGVLINGSAAAVPNDTDLVATADTSVLKKITWTNVKAFLKTYFDGLYQTILVSGTSIKTINGNSLLGSGDVTVTPNATHTGEVTGSGALTVDKTAITGKTAVTLDGADYILISDTSDSGNLKKGLISDIGFDDGDFTLINSFKTLYNF